MNTLDAFAKGFASAGREPMVFDWDKAARLIREHRATEASAGLDGDWEYTGGEIVRDGRPLGDEESYTFLASTWATPQLRIGDEVFPCFVMQSEQPAWRSDTRWPDSALAILRGER